MFDFKLHRIFELKEKEILSWSSCSLKKKVFTGRMYKDSFLYEALEIYSNLKWFEKRVEDKYLPCRAGWTISILQ